MEKSGSYGDELPPGAELCAGQYVIERYLNSGGFGVTYLARDSLGRSVVIKECFPSAMCHRSGQTVRLRSASSEDEFGAILELFEKEARALAALQHPYIVGVHQFFRDNGTAYMAMDFVDGKTLLDIIENEPDRLAPADNQATPAADSGGVEATSTATTSCTATSRPTTSWSMPTTCRC